MYVNFEIAALFPLPYSRVKKGGNFKTSILLVAIKPNISPFDHIYRHFFRQDNGDWIGTFMSTALQIVSLVSNVLGGGSEPSTNVDRVDTSGATAAAAAAAGGEDLDIAMGTLMAYGGKYLREIALLAYEYGTQTPVDSLGSATSGTSSVASPPATSALASVIR